MCDKIKTGIILLSGMITLLLKQFIPIGVGGISLIFVLSIPILSGLGIIFGVIYHLASKRLKGVLLKNFIFTIMIIVLIGLSFWFYPYDI